MSGPFGNNVIGGSSKPWFNPWRVYAVCALTCAGLTAAGYALGVAPAMARAARAEADRAELTDRKQHAADQTRTDQSDRYRMRR